MGFATPETCALPQGKIGAPADGQGRCGLQIVQRVDKRAVELDTEMAVVAGGAARRAHAGDELALVDLLPQGRHQTAVMPVVRLIPVAVVDDDQIAVPAHPAGVRHRAAVGGIDGRAVAVADVDAAVVGAAQQASIAEPAGEDAGAGPGERPGGIPGGPLLRAAELLLRHRLGQRHAGDHLALRLLAVDVRHVGGHVRLAVHAGGRDLILTLIHGRVVGVLHLVRHILHVPLPLHVHHRQIGHGVADGQHIAHPQDLRVIAGVQLHQRFHAQVVFLRDAVIAVAGGDGVRHLALLRLVEDLGDVAQVHHVGRLHVLLTDVHVLHEVGVHRVRRLIAQLQLLQQVLQRAGAGGGHHLFAVHIQDIGVIHHAEGVAQCLFKLVVGDQLAAGENACFGGEQRRIHGVAAVAGGRAGDILQLRHHLFGGAAGGDDAKVLTVIGHLSAQGVQGQNGGRGGDGHGAAQECHRVQMHLLKKVAAFAAHPGQCLAPVGEALAYGGGPALQAAAEEEEQLGCAVFGFGEPPVAVGGRQSPRIAAQIGQPPTNAAETRLYVQGEQIVVLIAEAPPAH